MEIEDESLDFINTKELPKEYLLLRLRMLFNNELYKKKIISFEVYNKMQNLLIRKMDKILLDIQTS